MNRVFNDSAEKSADLFQKPIRRMFILRVSQLKIVQRDFYQG